MTFAEAFSVKLDKTRQKKQNKDIIYFETAIYNVLHKRSSITAPWLENLKFQEKNDFYRSTLGEERRFKIKVTRIRQEI